jgi:hypothetical protein
MSSSLVDNVAILAYDNSSGGSAASKMLGQPGVDQPDNRRSAVEWRLRNVRP